VRILVLTKPVPDPAAGAERLVGPDFRLDRAASPTVVNGNDEYALEAALQLVEAHGGEVTLVSMGPEVAQSALRKGFSMGAAGGLQVTDPALRGADALGTAKVLAAAVQRSPFDLVLAGVESTDGYTGTTPVQVAELLGLPSVTFAKHIECDGSTVKVNRQTEAGYDEVESPLPCLVTVTAGVVEPRYPSFKGIMAAKGKPVEELKVGDLDIDGGVSVGQAITDVAAAEERKAGEVIEDDGDAHLRIIGFLESLKVI